MEPVRESILRRAKKDGQHDPLHSERSEEKEYEDEQDRLARRRRLREERNADILRRVNGKASREGALPPFHVDFHPDLGPKAAYECREA